jgi:hypothetical protein
MGLREEQALGMRSSIIVIKIFPLRARDLIA